MVSVAEYVLTKLVRSIFFLWKTKFAEKVSIQQPVLDIKLQLLLSKLVFCSVLSILLFQKHLKPLAPNKKSENIQARARKFHVPVCFRIFCTTVPVMWKVLLKQQTGGRDELCITSRTGRR
jgi:hypothetical protein